MISEETRKKRSDSLKRYYSIKENREKHSKIMKEATQSKEYRKKVSLKSKQDWDEHPERKVEMSIVQKNLWQNIEYRESRVKSMMDKWKDPEFIKSHKDAMNREEVKLKCSISGSKRTGPLNPAWKGGVSIEPYCMTWYDREFRNFILERDNYECKNPYCWKTNKVLTLHHIDYVKKNCVSENILTLCNSCNPRANRNRKYWERLYKRVIKNNEQRSLK